MIMYVDDECLEGIKRGRQKGDGSFYIEYRKRKSKKYKEYKHKIELLIKILESETIEKNGAR